MCPPETDAIKHALAGVVNATNIVDEAAILEQYCKDHSFVAGCSPQFLVYPQSKEEVQGLVRVKTGRAGGAYVYRPGRDSMADSVELLIRYWQSSPSVGSSRMIS